MTDLNTWFVKSNNETLEWCEDIMRDNDHYQYRPMEEILGLRNVALHNVMHHRPYQPEF